MSLPSNAMMARRMSVVVLGPIPPLKCTVINDFGLIFYVVKHIGSLFFQD